MAFVRFKTAFVGLCLAFSPFVATTSAEATYGPAIVADPGTYGTLALGEDFSFDICGSTIQGYSLCDIVTDAKYWMGLVIRKELQWYDQWIDVASLNGNQVNTQDGLHYTIATGEGTPYIFETGTYYVGVAFSTWGSGNSMTTSDGTVIQLNGDSVYTDWTYSARFTVGPAGSSTPTDPDPVNGGGSVGVPEPASYLLLLPILMFMAHRERRRRGAPAFVRV